MDIWELVKLSIKSLFSFKVRSFLTMLGIIVGIASVVSKEISKNYNK